MDSSDESPSKSLTKSKRLKTSSDSVRCIICDLPKNEADLVKPRDVISWQMLLDCAKLHNFQPILDFSTAEGVPNIYYHRSCRSNFTHKKTVQKLASQSLGTSQEVPCSSGTNVRFGTRQPMQSRVYEEKCIFCDKKSKYRKGTNTREPLVKSCEFRSDERIRSIAVQKMDSKILSITSRELVAAEAHYHKSCYIAYTRQRPMSLEPQEEQDETDTAYANAEEYAYDMLFDFIRKVIFQKPQVTTMVNLTEHLVQFMNMKDVKEVKSHTKKHIRRKLEVEFGNSLHIFPDDKGKLIVVPDNMTVQMIAVEYMKLKSKCDELSKSQWDASSIKNTPAHLRCQIKKARIKQLWPPQPEELNQNYVSIPTDVNDFLTNLIAGKESKKGPSSQVQTLIWSLAQDLLYGVNGGMLLTPKHILLPWAVKSLTGNVELIKILNRLGHGISYSKLMEIDTALCLQKLLTEEEQGVAIPSNVLTDVPTVLAYDNIDRREETLSGEGTSHRVNGIIVQAKGEVSEPSRSKVQLEKEKRRSITPTPLQLPDYIAGQRCGPEGKAAVPLDTQDEEKIAHKKNLIWSITRLQDTANQCVPSWTGFNIQTRMGVPVVKDTVSYLPTINAPATQLSTVFGVLNQALKIMKALNLQEIVCVFDQALYAKAAEIAWKHQTLFKPIILRMGAFHTTCMFLSIIGKRFCDAGLRDLAVESGVIAEGSIDSVLEGRQYNRGVRFHKLVYEALMRLAWKGFISWLEQHYNGHLHLLSDVSKCLEKLKEELCREKFSEALNDQACNKILDLFTDYMNKLRSANGDLSTFWMSYIDLVSILLEFIRASREGNWCLHLHAVSVIIPWCFAYDRQNYARFLPVYLRDMLRLASDHPRVYEHFKNGGFSVQIGDNNPFGRIPVDQTIEETVNKDTQTAGGTKGFSLKPAAVTKYYLTAEYRSTCLKLLRNMIDLQNVGVGHADLEPSRIERDEADVESLEEILDTQWTNPFNHDPSDIVSLSTGKAVPMDVARDLLEALKKGTSAYETFRSERLEPGSTKSLFDTIHRMKLKTFTSINQKQQTKTRQKETILKADRRLFGQMVLISMKRNLDMREVLRHPLGPLPWSLSNSDGTMKKTNKAALARALEKKVAPADNVPEPSACVMDGMCLLQRVHGENITFAELSAHVFDLVLNNGGSSERIDVVFDVYRDLSIKAAERTSRGSDTGVVFSTMLPGHRIKQWRRLLSCPSSKSKLIEFVVADWQTENTRKKLGSKVLYVTCGENCLRITSEMSESIDKLSSTQEEADTRMLLHASHAASHYDSVMITADDTDVLVLCIAFQDRIDAHLYVKCGTKTRKRILDVTKMCSALGRNACGSLLGLHAYTGCDTVSAFSGQGKLKALKLLLENTEFQEAFMDLGQRWYLRDNVYKVLQELTCRLFSPRTSINDVNELRFHLFRAKKGEIESGQLPPCNDCLYMHALRANYQAAIWHRCLNRDPEIPLPQSGHGWELDEDHNLCIKWMMGAPAPDVVLEFLSCTCKRACEAPDCACLGNGLKCTDACYLKECSNMRLDDDEQEAQDIFDEDI